jgi:hypothetical protein
MFLHLGGNKVIRTKDVVAIISVEKTTTGIKSFPKVIRETTDEGMKSMIFTDKKIYLSPISSATLKKRADYPSA